MPRKHVIDLGLIATDPARDTLSGRPEGEASRGTLNLGDNVVDEIEVVVPPHVRVVTPSFFIGLLAASLKDVEAARRVHIQGATPTTEKMWERARSAMFGTFSPFDNLPRRHGLFGR